MGHGKYAPKTLAVAPVKYAPMMVAVAPGKYAPKMLAVAPGKSCRVAPGKIIDYPKLELCRRGRLLITGLDRTRR